MIPQGRRRNTERTYINSDCTNVTISNPNSTLFAPSNISSSIPQSTRNTRDTSYVSPISQKPISTNNSTNKISIPQSTRNTRDSSYINSSISKNSTSTTSTNSTYINSSIPKNSNTTLSSHKAPLSSTDNDLYLKNQTKESGSTLFYQYLLKNAINNAINSSIPESTRQTRDREYISESTKYSSNRSPTPVFESSSSDSWSPIPNIYDRYSPVFIRDRRSPIPIIYGSNEHGPFFYLLIFLLLFIIILFPFSIIFLVIFLIFYHYHNKNNGYKRYNI